ncbi:ATP-binding protein [Actinosynnema sp. NPDC059335]|uniref:ATP-binding protein n=1 Tax=Actinosynnema sp. NPDC059335 TaxID=3346804 RepID=UPI00366D31A6
MITDDGPANRPRPAEPADPRVFELVGEEPDLAGVRRWTEEVLADLTDDEITDAKLVVSELVTNAYQHGEHPLHLRLRRTRGLIRVEVTDLSPHVPVVGRSSVRVTRGRGMVLVDRLSRRWGVVRHAVGKTVWAVLTRHSRRTDTTPTT